MEPALLPAGIEPHILVLREQRVMLDADLARLYGVETRVLVQAVKRNLARFPADFMFQLTAREFAALKSQTVISNPTGAGPGRGGRRSAPYAFTEQGVAMLSSVLGSERAIRVNIEIMRSFVRVRAVATSHAELAKRLDEVERLTRALAQEQDEFSQETRAQLQQVFTVIEQLMTPPEPPAPPQRPIGFLTAPESAPDASPPGPKKPGPKKR
jgi:hypothetical protein